ncbi:hypothetical protein Dimus_013403 [Dionaea muscipula]
MFRESWMIDNGLSNVMDLIKRQKWEKLFNRRELMHIDAVKEFYVRLTLVHYKKKDVVRSSVRGVDIEFDHLSLASILGIPGNNGICEYIKEVWEESKYTKPLEITRKFANDNMIMEARRLRKENGVWWLGTGDHRRRDDDVEEVNNNDQAVNEEEQNPDFDWEAVDDEAALQGESVSGEKFFDAEDEVQGSKEVSEEIQDIPAPAQVQQKDKAPAGVDPSAPIGSFPDSVMIQLQANFERARANKIQADLEKAQAENSRLLALLQQA